MMLLVSFRFCLSGLRLISARCAGLFLLIVPLHLLTAYGSEPPVQEVLITNGEWPPFMSSHLKHGGLASHIVTRAFEQAGIQARYIYLPWKRGLNETRDGKYAATIGWVKNTDRIQNFLISEPIFQDHGGIFYNLTAEKDWRSTNDFSGARTAKVLGYDYSLLDRLGIHAQITTVSVPTDEVAFRMLMEDRVDLVPSSSLDVGYAMMRKLFKGTSNKCRCRLWPKAKLKVKAWF